MRAIPALIPAAVILIPAAGLGLAVYSLAVNGSEKLRSQLILIAVGTALIAGNWDGWQAFENCQFSNADSQLCINRDYGRIRSSTNLEQIE